MGKNYKIRRYENGAAKKTGKSFVNFSLTVPNHIAEAVPEGVVFEPEMTEDGILYRPVVAETVEKVPAWAQPAAAANGKTARKRSAPRKRPGQKPAEATAATD